MHLDDILFRRSANYKCQRRNNILQVLETLYNLSMLEAGERKAVLLSSISKGFSLNQST